MKSDVLQGLKNISIALIFAFLIAWVGSSLKSSWLVIPLATTLAGIGGALITRNDSPNTRKKVTVGFAFLGLLFSGIAYFTT